MSAPLEMVASAVPPPPPPPASHRQDAVVKERGEADSTDALVEDAAAQRASRVTMAMDPLSPGAAYAPGEEATSVDVLA